ncbi:uncharacterized protein SPSK_05352 [Sporothrix schenckii 1099-18]|uniref:Uncharacterized protein n=1 Tax=Sporothrix schenckii 1099-18 TaxID=1397361 RepID=A0A0F2LRY2_SPOSC|nr:uncharacterized protein SPSK_05352 [Sporothrix schenckii 1099-18]KJR80267.1 hypothetical protein SPSK_05352 [Sporothrix schenckii 1099-18]
MNRIRAATKPTGTELSTPAELFAKAVRQGTHTLTPIECHLLGHGFRVEESAFEDDDFSDEEQERANKKAKTMASSLFNQFGIPGNREAYVAAGKEEVASTLRSSGSPSRPSGKHQGRRRQRDSLPRSLPRSRRTSLPERRNLPDCPPSSLLVPVLPSSGVSSVPVPPSHNLDSVCLASLLFNHSNGPALVLACPVVMVSLARLVVLACLATSVGPGPAKAAGILDEVTKALLYIHGERRTKRMGRNDFDERFNNIVASIHGLADRFAAALPPTPLHPLFRGPLRDQIPLLPPSRVFGPNPFGLRLSHDGSQVNSAGPYTTRDELPRSST